MPLAFFLLTQYRRVTDGRRTDTLRSLLPALAYRRAGNKSVRLGRGYPARFIRLSELIVNLGLAF